MGLHQSVVDAAVDAFPEDHQPYMQEIFEHLSEMLKAERLSDWEKVGVRAGKFCEATASYIQALGDEKLDGKISKPRNMVAACKAFESFGNLTRPIRIQVPRVIVSVYELRNNSGFAHVTSERVGLEGDSKLISQSLRWCFAVLCDANSAMKSNEIDLVVEILSNPIVGAVWRHGDALAVTSPGLSAREEALIILASLNGEPMNANELASHVAYSNKSRFKREILGGMEKQKELKVVGQTVHLLPLGFQNAVKLTAGAGHLA